jgi:hypothetical protein
MVVVVVVVVLLVVVVVDDLGRNSHDLVSNCRR